MLGPQSFHAGVSARLDRLRVARIALGAAQAKHAAHRLPRADELAAAWPQMSLVEQRQLIRTVLDCVFITRGRRPVEERLTIFRAGAGPTDLPSPRDAHSRLRPFELPDRPAAIEMPTAELCPWPPDTLRQRLRRFTRGRTSWPTPVEFTRAGRHVLLRQTVFHGGERYWATQLGLNFTGPKQRSGPWIEARIRATLGVFLSGRTCWPSHAEFRANGLVPLHGAIGRNGGARRWAAEFEMPFAHYPTGYWTQVTVRQTLTVFCAGRASFPTAAEFKTANLGGLLAALRHEHSAQRWATELGLPRR